MVYAVALSFPFNPSSPHHLESSLKVESVGLTNELCRWPQAWWWTCGKSPGWISPAFSCATRRVGQRSLLKSCPHSWGHYEQHLCPVPMTIHKDSMIMA